MIQQPVNACTASYQQLELPSAWLCTVTCALHDMPPVPVHTSSMYMMYMFSFIIMCAHFLCTRAFHSQLCSHIASRCVTPVAAIVRKYMLATSSYSEKLHRHACIHVCTWRSICMSQYNDQNVHAKTRGSAYRRSKCYGMYDLGVRAKHTLILLIYAICNVHGQI